MEKILGVAMLWLFLLCGWSWVRLAMRGRPLLPWAARRPSPWTLLDIAAAFLLMLFLPAAVTVLAVRLELTTFKFSGEPPSADQLADLLVCNAIGSVLTIAAIWGMMRVRHNAGLREWGFDPRHFLPDIGLGVVAFVTIVPPVLLIQLLLTQWFPPEHAITTLLQERRDPLFFLIAGIAAVVVAPISEELLFRVLLQGWLERLSTFTLPAVAAPVEESLLEDNAPAADDAPAAGDAWETDEQSPYRSPRSASTAPLEPAPTAGERPAPAWPILVSAAIFGLMDLGNGPSPIPLFFLALGLGYLYQRTHRILPCIVVHMLLNGMTLATIWIAPNATAP